MPYWHGGGTGFAYWWIFPLFFGSLWLLLIGVAIWFAVRWSRLSGRRNGTDPVPRSRIDLREARSTRTSTSSA